MNTLLLTEWVLCTYKKVSKNFSLNIFSLGRDSGVTSGIPFRC